MTIFFLYIDPGSGSYLVQIVIAGVLGIIYFFKNIRVVLIDFFSKIFKKKH